MSEPPRILVVDDDAEIRVLLSTYLERNGYRAAAVGDGAEARRVLAEADFDLIVLDLMLPNENGLEICRHLRATSDVPIIMLTALGDEVDRIVGLEVGADDYVAKPFSPRELLGRIRAVLRRTLQTQREPSPNATGAPVAYRFAGWRLDLTARALQAPGDERIALGGAEFRLLAALLERAPAVVSRAELMQQMRNRELDPFDRSIDVRVSRLRQILGDDAKQPAILKTIYGEGYAIGVAVETER